MKRFQWLIPLLAILLCTVSYAHSGRTDANGGHYNRSTGEYHYHHGYPEHQHINGTCPYNFDDRTGWNSGASSSRPINIADDTDDKIVNDEIDPPQPKQEKDSSSIKPLAIFLAGIGSLLLISVAISSVRGLIKKSKRKKERKKERQKYAALYEGKNIAQLCHIPPDTEIGNDGLPKLTSSPKWGDKYTFYVSKSGNRFHSSPNCTKGAQTPVHAWHATYLDPCKRCSPVLPDLNWFAEYQRIKKIVLEYQIPTQDIKSNLRGK